MSILSGVMREEYDRLNRIIEKVEQEIEVLPKGYISEKNIHGKKYYYLQYREGDKVRSVYLKKGEVETHRDLIDRRNELMEKLKELKEDCKKLERVLG